MTAMQSYRITEDKSDPVTMRFFVAASDEAASVVAQKYADDESETESVSLQRTGRIDESPVFLGQFGRTK